MDAGVGEPDLPQLEMRWREAERAYLVAARTVGSGCITMLLGIVAGAFLPVMFALVLFGALALALGLSQRAGARRRLEATAQQLAQPQVTSASGTWSAGDRASYDQANVKVTRSNLTVGTRVFPLAGVTAIELAQEFPNPVLGVAGLAASLAWSACPAVSLQTPLAFLAAGQMEAAEAGGLVPLGVMAAIGLALAGLCALYLVTRPSYLVRLESKADHRTALITHDGLHAIRVVRAAREALALRHHAVP